MGARMRRLTARCGAATGRPEWAGGAGLPFPIEDLLCKPQLAHMMARLHARAWRAAERASCGATVGARDRCRARQSVQNESHSRINLHAHTHGRIARNAHRECTNARAHACYTARGRCMRSARAAAYGGCVQDPSQRACVAADAHGTAGAPLSIDGARFTTTVGASVGAVDRGDTER
jgi:hypothetical protein